MAGFFSNFTDVVSSVEKTPHEERLARSLLARLLEKTYIGYRSIGKSAIDLSDDWDRVQREVGGALTDISDDDFIVGKRQPLFQESVSATLERYSVIEALPSFFAESVDAIIVGGSMSYGPFFNVRDNGRDQSSDIDIICVGSDTLLENQIETTDDEAFLSEADIEALAARSKTFSNLYQDGNANILSQRFSLPGHTFDMSAHFFPQTEFNTLVGTKVEELLTAGQDRMVLFNDFKQAPFIHPICFQQGFDGNRREYIVPEQREVKNGVVTSISGYEVADGRMYHGLYHHLISPEYTVLFDARGVAASLVQNFRQVMVQQLEKERESFPESSLARCHIRYHVFAPERYTT